VPRERRLDGEPTGVYPMAEDAVDGQGESRRTVMSIRFNLKRVLVSCAEL
jgi:hypothetical protein